MKGETFVDYGLALIICNILIYLILSLALFVILLTVWDKSYNTLNKFKNLQGSYFLFTSVLLLLLSLAGIPPLLGFVGKFILYMYLLIHKSYLLFSLFLSFNVFILYFYIQNIRFMVTKTPNKLTITNHNSTLVYEFSTAFILGVLFFNTFGIFFFEAGLTYVVSYLSI